MHFRLSSRLAKSVKAKCRTISRQYTDYRRNRKIAKSTKYEVAQSPQQQPGVVNPFWQGENYQFVGDPDDWDQHLESGSELEYDSGLAYDSEPQYNFVSEYDFESEYDSEEHIDEEQYLRYGFDVDDFINWWRTFESALSDSVQQLHAHNRRVQGSSTEQQDLADQLAHLSVLELRRNPLNLAVSFCKTNVQVSGVRTLLETYDPLRGMAKVFDQLNRDELVAYIWPSDIREHVEHMNTDVDEKPLNSTLSS
ncbi:hypothetical protein BHE90_013881 [Fusarium euwallaceae]|uniref:Uncharacterized protein n=1 Tax=Fusarium euwallaceae TaxID=1147111 RepID=A0A430L7R5_9HYPO|nr:hypothetical protein BHE90_013881 [Fusarium euwallaceae]